MARLANKLDDGQMADDDEIGQPANCVLSLAAVAVAVIFAAIASVQNHS